MAGRIWASVCSLALLAAGSAAQGPGNFTSEAMAEGYAAAVAAAGKPHLNYDILPTERPLLDSMAQLGRWGAAQGGRAGSSSWPPLLFEPAGARRHCSRSAPALAASRRNWWSNDFTVLESMSLETMDGGMDPGVANLTMVYRPLNTTSEQASWVLCLLLALGVQAAAAAVVGRWRSGCRCSLRAARPPLLRALNAPHCCCPRMRSTPAPARQMAWFFNHLADLNVTLPFDGERYPMYTILHPVRGPWRASLPARRRGREAARPGSQSHPRGGVAGAGNERCCRPPAGRRWLPLACQSLATARWTTTPHARRSTTSSSWPARCRWSRAPRSRFGRPPTQVSRFNLHQPKEGGRRAGSAGRS